MTNRPFAYGESSYDFAGVPTPRKFRAATTNYGYVPGQNDNTTQTTPEKEKDTTTKTLLYIAGGAIVVTGLLIFILGRRKK